MRSILAMVDFSGESVTALKTAHYWSRLSGAQLHVFHKTESLAPGLGDTEIKEEIGEQAAQEARETLQQLLKTHIGNDMEKVQTHVTYKRLLPELSKLIGEFHFDIIFSGVKSKGVLSDIFIGNTVMKLINNYSIPVAAIPVDYNLNVPINLYVGVSPVHDFNTHILEKVVKPLGIRLEKLEFVTVLTKDDDAATIESHLREVTKAFPYLHNCSTNIIESTDIFSGLKSITSRDNGSMLIVQKGKRAFDDMLFRELLVNQLVTDARVPLIILP